MFLCPELCGKFNRHRQSGEPWLWTGIWQFNPKLTLITRLSSEKLPELLDCMAVCAGAFVYHLDVVCSAAQVSLSLDEVGQFWRLSGKTKCKDDWYCLKGEKKTASEAQQTDLHVPVPYFAFLYDIGELSDPDEAVVWGDEQEAVSAVQRGSSGLH